MSEYKHGSPVVILKSYKYAGNKAPVKKGMRGRLIAPPGPNVGIVSLVLYGDPKTDNCHVAVIELPRELFGPDPSPEKFWSKEALNQ